MSTCEEIALPRSSGSILFEWLVSRRFSDRELRSLQRLVEMNRDKIFETWHEHFSH